MNIVQTEVLARRVCIALNDGDFSVVEVGKTNIVPAGVCNTRAITWAPGVNSSCVIGPREVFHHDRGIVDSSGGGTISKLSLGGALVGVALGDENGEGNIVSSAKISKGFSQILNHLEKRK